MFKKRVSKGNLRAKQDDKVQEVDVERDMSLEEDQLTLIRELREGQRDRRRVGGIEAGKLMSASGEHGQGFCGNLQHTKRVNARY